MLFWSKVGIWFFWVFFFFAAWLRRIPLDTIPENESECAMWLHKLYQEKVRESHVYLVRKVMELFFEMLKKWLNTSFFIVLLYFQSQWPVLNLYTSGYIFNMDHIFCLFCYRMSCRKNTVWQVVFLAPSWRLHAAIGPCLTGYFGSGFSSFPYVYYYCSSFTLGQLSPFSLQLSCALQVY